MSQAQKKSFQQSVREVRAFNVALQGDVYAIDAARIQEMARMATPLFEATRSWYYKALNQTLYFAMLACAFPFLFGVFNLVGHVIGVITGEVPSCSWATTLLFFGLGGMGTTGFLLLAMYLESAAEKACNVFLRLTDLSEHSALCMDALAYVQKYPEAAALRDAVVARGEALKLFHFYAMRSFACAATDAATQEENHRVCLQLHGIVVPEATPA